jgi:hypothetical protein
MQLDRQFRVSGSWALASDGVQWIIQKWAGNAWRGVKFIRSDKAWLEYRLRVTLKVPPADADRLLAGLPSSFDEWKRAVHDVFGAPKLPNTQTAPRGENERGTLWRAPSAQGGEGEGGIILYRFLVFVNRGMSWPDASRAAWRSAAERRRWRAMWRERYWK